MEFEFLIVCFAYFQIANSQYYTLSASSFPSSYNYYPSSAPSFAPATSNIQPRSITSSPKSPKLNDGSTAKPSVRCSPQTASAYFLSTPSEKVKANVLSKDKLKEAKAPPFYSCALCNNFANVPPNSKIPPPPPIGSPVLPGIVDTIPTITMPKNLTTMDPKSILSQKTSFSDMYEQNKVPKNLSFDQELLEGFLTGLGIAL